ncbi:MAG: DUF420 domain-containing protein [Candidatus Delongbacteria bacterium]
MMIPGTRASWLAGVELLLGLLITGVLLAGVRQAWLGRREVHVRTMRRLLLLLGAFLAVFVANVARRGGVEALGPASGPAFLGLLLLHVLLALAGGVLLLRVIGWGWRGRRPGGAAQLARHRRWGGFTAGFWLVNSLLGALVFLVAYVL